VAIVADWPWDVGNDDAPDFWHAWLALIEIDAWRLAAVAPVGQYILCLPVVSQA